VLEEVAAGVNGDLRQVLNLMQMWANTGGRVGMQEAKNRMKNAGKDFTIGTPWQLIKDIFEIHRVPKEKRLNRVIDYYFKENSLLPLFMQENYLTASKRMGDSLDTLKKISDSANAIADADILEGYLRSTNNWTVAPVIGILSLGYPAMVLRVNAPMQNLFPQYLGKRSRTNKSYRLLSELQAHMNRTVTGGCASVCMDYLPLFREKLGRPLVHQGEAGIPAVLELMKTYQMSREDWEAIVNEVGVDMSQVDPDAFKVEVDKKTKSAFTRRANEVLQMHNESKKQGRVTAALMRNEDGELVEGKDDKDEKDPAKAAKKKKDKFIKEKKIKKKKAPKKKKKATAKKKSKSKSSSRGGSKTGSPKKKKGGNIFAAPW